MTFDVLEGCYIGKTEIPLWVFVDVFDFMHGMVIVGIGVIWVFG